MSFFVKLKLLQYHMSCFTTFIASIFKTCLHICYSMYSYDSDIALDEANPTVLHLY